MILTDLGISTISEASVYLTSFFHIEIQIFTYLKEINFHGKLSLF